MGRAKVISQGRVVGMKRTKIIDVNNGDGLCFKDGQHFYLTCCDCNLTHKITTKVTKKSEATIFISRDDRRTNQKRRRAKESGGRFDKE